MANVDPDANESPKASTKPRLSENKLLLAAIPAAVSIVAAILAAISASSARDDANRFAQQKLTRDERMKVYERVEAQLGSDQSNGILIASAYTDLIEDAEVKQNLCELINLVAKERIESTGNTDTRAGHIATLTRIARDAEQCSEELRRAIASFQASHSDNRAPTPPASELQQEQTVLTPNPNPRGWDIDVFSCEGQGDRSRQLATTVAQRLAQYSRTNQPLDRQPLGRIRLRHASVAAQRRLTEEPLGHSVLGSTDEQQLLNAVVADLNPNLGGIQFGIRQAPPNTPWYISVFACGFAQ